MEVNVFRQLFGYQQLTLLRLEFRECMVILYFKAQFFAMNKPLTMIFAPNS